jgi:CheY-like chemotaxis protein
LVLANPTIKNLAVSDDVKEIKLAAERASELTRQILAFSRRQALQPVPVLLNTIIAGMEPLLRRTLGEHIDLVTHLDPDIEHVAVDVHQFEHVVINLALNARDAMSNGGRLLLETMDVELDEDYCLKHADASPGRYVMLSVLDTGAGMDDNTKSHMFEPFFTTKGPGQGTGLGLSTVYGIVRQSGGTIEVLSEAGKGTELRVYLPRICRPPEIIPEPLSPAPHIHGAETILVVEDEDALRALVVRVLRGLGYEVFSAGDAEEALGLMTTHGAAVDLLLTDVILRGPMQGNDLVRILEPAWPDLRILYMSGYSRDTIIHSGRVNPGVNLLEKPFTPESLAAKLRDTLDQQR